MYHINGNQIKVIEENLVEVVLIYISSTIEQISQNCASNLPFLDNRRTFTKSCQRKILSKIFHQIIFTFLRYTIFVSKHCSFYRQLTLCTNKCENT